MKSDNDSVIEFEWIEVNIDDDCKAVQPDADAQPEVVETQQPESKAVSAVRNIFGYNQCQYSYALNGSSYRIGRQAYGIPHGIFVCGT